jgi:hypothetical protein
MGIGLWGPENPESKEKREENFSAFAWAYQVYQDLPACGVVVARQSCKS